MSRHGKPSLARGRPRNEGSSAAILAAAIDLVAEVGIAALTIDAVARRAGVGKATIYRRWSSKEALMLDAWMECLGAVAMPDTGSLRSDLLQHFQMKEKPMSDAELRRVFPQMLAAARVDPEVEAAYRAFIHNRRQPVRQAIIRARDRGELPGDVEIDLVQDMILAPLMYRWLVTEGPVDLDMFAGVIDLVLAGARALAAEPA